MKKKTNWKKVADEQFNAMPKEFQDDWQELRNQVNRHR
jgi:hypothetical protein